MQQKYQYNVRLFLKSLDDITSSIVTSLLELKCVFFQAHLSGFSFLINQLIMPAKCKINSIHFEIITYHVHSCNQDSTLTPCGYNKENGRSSHMEPTHTHMQI